VLAPGARTTVEDLGRSGVARFGVPPGGAFDPGALLALNRLLGNADDAAGLEITLSGPELWNTGDEPIALAVAGAALRTPEDGFGTTRRTSTLLLPGNTIVIGPQVDAARAWVGFSGGIDVPVVLGSRSTCTAGGFGGIGGRPLRREDQLRIGASAQSFAEGVGDRTPSEQTARWESGCAQLRILPGPQAHLWPGDPRTDLENTLWTVAPDSDRVGVRLRASDPTFAARLAMSRGIAPEGTVFGAIQITPDGGAIVLGPDRPVTGGYPMPAIVVSADLGVLARLRPGERLRMRRSTRVDAARARSLSPVATSRS
jgi:biotin-dependent carboxylase-like uncharacterized protein